MYIFIFFPYLFISSFIYLYIYSFIHLFISTFIYFYIYLFLHLCFSTFIYFFIYFFLHFFLRRVMRRAWFTSDIAIELRVSEGEGLRPQWHPVAKYNKYHWRWYGLWLRGIWLKSYCVTWICSSLFRTWS